MFCKIDIFMDNSGFTILIPVFDIFLIENWYSVCFFLFSYFVGSNFIPNWTSHWYIFLIYWESKGGLKNSKVLFSRDLILHNIDTFRILLSIYASCDTWTIPTSQYRYSRKFDTQLEKNVLIWIKFKIFRVRNEDSSRFLWKCETNELIAFSLRLTRRDNFSNLTTFLI